MKRLKQSGPCTTEKKAPSPGFRLMETLRENRYQRLIDSIQSIDAGLEGIRKKQESLKTLERSSQEAIADQECSNWDDVSARMRDMMASREALRKESASASIMLFGKSLLQLGSVGAALAFTIRLATQEFPNAFVMAVGGLIITATAIMKAWAKNDLCSPEYIRAIESDLESQRSRLIDGRRRLMRRMHGFREDEG